MKAERQESFKPVVLTLETQQEVDAIFAYLNHTVLGRVTGLGDLAFMVLEKYATQEARNLHDKINSAFK